MKQFDMERPSRRALTQAIAALNYIDSSDSDVDDHGSSSEQSEGENLEGIHERQQTEAASVPAPASTRDGGRERARETFRALQRGRGAAIPIPNLWTDKNERNGAQIRHCKDEVGRRMFSTGKVVLARRCGKTLLEVWEMFLPDSIRASENS